ncbi:cysteine desulfurase, partial [Candidatus Woesearchaeota archaeon CG11_big_fil_rev_8_21_14_0_20_57_5]
MAESKNIAGIRDDFPLLSRRVHGEPLAYLDNAATTQKPRQVLDAMEQYYVRHNANIHRGVHTLAGEATDAYEGAREKVARFIGARSQDIIFTKNATEALNIPAYGLG